MYIWDDVITDEEKEILNAGGMGCSLSGYGEKMAILIVDMSYGFTDSRFPLGSTEYGAPCVEKCKRVLDVAREHKVPVYYSNSEWRDNPVERGLWKRTPGVNERLQDPLNYTIVKELEPLSDEPVVIKFAPSAFHGTNLVNMMVQKRIDTVVIMGMVTSGCVYATAVDAFSYGFKTIVPEDCVADRSITSHKISLFNIHMKYGDVVTADDVIKKIAE